MPILPAPDVPPGPSGELGPARGQIGLAHIAFQVAANIVHALRAEERFIGAVAATQIENPLARAHQVVIVQHVLDAAAQAAISKVPQAQVEDVVADLLNDAVDAVDRLANTAICVGGPTSGSSGPTGR